MRDETPFWADKWIGDNCAGCGTEYRWSDNRVKCDCSVIRMGVVGTEKP